VQVTEGERESTDLERKSLRGGWGQMSYILYYSSRLHGTVSINSHDLNIYKRNEKFAQKQ